MSRPGTTLPVVRFSQAEDDRLLRRFLFSRPHPRWSNQNVAKCENVVGNANYCIAVDPVRLMREFPGMEYQLKNFPAVIWRGRPPRGATLLVFPNGRTVQMGMNSDPGFFHSVQRFRMELLQKPNYLPSLKPIYFANRVYSFDIGHHIAIWDVEFTDELGCAWLPALFPGLVYRLFRPRVTALVFVSGKQMLLGVQHPDHLEPALDHLVPILRQHQYHGTQANADRKSILRQAERTLQAKLRQQAQLSVLPMNPEDTKRWEAAQKAHKRQMNKAIKLASKRNDINSLQEMRTAIQAEYETIHRKEERKEARKRSRKEESDGEDDDDDALMMDDGEEQQPPQSVMSIVAAAGGDVQDMPELLENTLLARLIN